MFSALIHICCGCQYAALKSRLNSSAAVLTVFCIFWECFKILSTNHVTPMSTLKITFLTSHLLSWLTSYASQIITLFLYCIAWLMSFLLVTEWKNFHFMQVCWDKHFYEGERIKLWSIHIINYTSKLKESGGLMSWS